MLFVLAYLLFWFFRYDFKYIVSIFFWIGSMLFSLAIDLPLLNNLLNRFIITSTI